MTIRELYDRMGGSYEHACKVMKMDKLIDRYVRRFKDSQVGEKLAAAGKTMDGTALFEAAHSMKGVCLNLGLDELGRRAEEITEEFRLGRERRMTDEEVREKLAGIDALYRHTVEEIDRYASGG